MGADPDRADATHAPRTQAAGDHMHHGLHRPPWKRVVLTIVGVLLFVTGTVLWLIPVLPGGFLAYLGIPFLFAASPRHEAWVRRWITYRLLRLRARLRRLERRWLDRQRAGKT